LNQFSIGFPTFVRNYNRLEGREVATEHTMETSTEKLWAVGEKRGWTNMSPDTKVKGKVVPGENWYEGFKPWAFQKEKPAAGSVNTISYEFWSGYSEYAVKWVYDPATNTYKREMAGVAHTDLNENAQIAASNVVVFKTQEKGPLNEKKHMFYQTNGTGAALIFQNGQVIEGKWAKKEFGQPITFTDAKGKPVEFVPGQIWISVLSATADVTY
jgi:hypothetical protein